MLADIASASSSVHINQFGFRPGLVGDRFAAALIAKAQEGVPVRLIVDRQGSDPERGSREFYERLTEAGIQVCVDARHTAAGAARAARRRRGDRLEPERAGAHRPSQGRRRRRSDRLGRWCRNRGSFRERRVSRPVRPRRRARSSRSCSSCSSPACAGSAARSRRAVSRARSRRSTRARAPSRQSCSTTRRVGSGRSPTAIAALIDGARDTLDVVNPYVTDRGMIGRIVAAADRGARVRLFVPGEPQQLGLWRGRAVPPQAADRGRRADPGLSEDAAREGVRRRRRARARRHLQPRGVEPEAILRDRHRVRVHAISRRSSTSSSSPPPRRSASDLQPPSTFKERARAAAFAAISPLL